MATVQEMEQEIANRKANVQKALTSAVRRFVEDWIDDYGYREFSQSTAVSMLRTALEAGIESGEKRWRKTFVLESCID